MMQPAGGSCGRRGFQSSRSWLGPAAADVHDMAGPELRGLGIGVYFFAVIIAYGIGSLIIGQLNDWLGATTTPLNMRYSMLLCPLACFIAAVSLWRGSRAAGASPSS